MGSKGVEPFTSSLEEPGFARTLQPSVVSDAFLVGRDGIEPSTSSLSVKRSTSELPAPFGRFGQPCTVSKLCTTKSPSPSSICLERFLPLP